MALALAMALSAIGSVVSYADSTPKQEFRAAWFTPVNGGWPVYANRGNVTALKKRDYQQVKSSQSCRPQCCLRPCAPFCRPSVQ